MHSQQNDRPNEDMTDAELKAEFVNIFNKLDPVSQSAINAYETGYRRFPVSVLLPLAKYLGLTLDELVGETATTRKRGPTPKLQRQLEEIGRMPRAKQKLATDMLDAIIQQ